MEEENKGQEPQAAQQPQPVEQQPQVSPEQDLTPEQALEETEFKSLKELVKSQKEGHSTVTKLSQEKKELEAALQGQYAPAQPAQPPTGQGTTDFYDDPETHTKRIVDERLSQAMVNLEARNAINTVRARDPAKFDQLRKYTQDIYARKPHLNNLGIEGLESAMKEAGEIRKNELLSLKKEILSAESPSSPAPAGNQPVNESSLKEQHRQEFLQEMQRGQDGYIPPTGQRPMNADQKAKRDEMIKKGDVDGLIEGVLKDIPLLK